MTTRSRPLCAGGSYYMNENEWRELAHDLNQQINSAEWVGDKLSYATSTLLWALARTGGDTAFYEFWPDMKGSPLETVLTAIRKIPPL